MAASAAARDGGAAPTCRVRSPYPEFAMASKNKDAIALLKADHEAVEALFTQYEQLTDGGNSERKLMLARQICAELAVHMQIEEEIFYPAARRALDDDPDVFDEAVVEHASARELIAQLVEMEPDESLFDAKIRVLGEYIRHHVQEEHDEMFPKIENTELDLAALGRQLAARKQELLEEFTDVLDALGEEGARTRRGLSQMH
jgi:hypothetical protein